MVCGFGSAWSHVAGRMELKLMESKLRHVGSAFVGKGDDARCEVDAKRRNRSRWGVNTKKPRLQDALQKDEHGNRPLDALVRRKAKKLE